MTHKKIILMALMGVMLSDAEAAKRVQRGNPTSSSRGRGARVKPQMKAGQSKSQNVFGDLLADEDTGAGNVNTEQELPAPAPQTNELGASEDKPTLDEDKLAAKFRVSSSVKEALSLKDDQVDGYAFLAAALGKDANELNEVRGQGSRLKAWAALGESSDRLSSLLPGQAGYDLIKIAVNNKNARVGALDPNDIKGGTGVALAANKMIKVAGTDVFDFTDVQINDTSGNEDQVAKRLQDQYDAFIDDVNKTKLVDVNGNIKEFNVENKASFLAGLGNKTAAPAAQALRSTAAKAYNEAINSFMDQLKNATKEKVFLPVLTKKDDIAALDTKPTTLTQGFDAGSSVQGVKVSAATKAYALRLIDLKSGGKKSILESSLAAEKDFPKYAAKFNPKADDATHDVSVNKVITDPGVQAFKKAAELYYSQEVDKKSEFSLEKLLNDISAEARKEVNTTGLQKARAENKKDKIDAEKVKIANKMQAIVQRSMSKQGLSRFANAVPKDPEDIVG